MGTTSEFTVTGMTCAHCEGAVREHVEALPGVLSVEVSAQTGVLRVTGSVDREAVADAVVQAGYRLDGRTS